MDHAILIANEQYKTIREVTLAFLTESEFALKPHGGTVTKTDLETAGVRSVIIKYNKGRRLVAFVL